MIVRVNVNVICMADNTTYVGFVSYLHSIQIYSKGCAKFGLSCVSYFVRVHGIPLRCVV
jgi:hypothetical protein